MKKTRRVLTEEQKEAYRTRARAWREAHREQSIQNSRRWREEKRKDPEWREKNRAYKREYYRQADEAKKKYARRLADGNALTACAKCGRTENLERHHPNYDKPKEVLILCQECHKNLHKKF